MRQNQRNLLAATIDKSLPLRSTMFANQHRKYRRFFLREFSLTLLARVGKLAAIHFPDTH